MIPPHIELISFLELEKGARSTSTVAPEPAVNQVSRTSSEIETNDLMDTFVQILTEKLNKALPHSGKTQDSNTYKTQNSRSSSVESNGNESVRFQTSNTRTINTKDNIEDGHRNREKRTKTTVTGNPANTANGIVTIPGIVRPASSAAEWGISEMNAEATRTII